MTGRRIFSRIGPPRTNMSRHISCIALTPPAADYHVTLSRNSGSRNSGSRNSGSRNSRVFAMPVGMLLVGARGLDYGDIVAGASHELQAYGKIFVGEAAGNRKRRQPAQISDAAQRVGVRKSGLEI